MSTPGDVFNQSSKIMRTPPTSFLSSCAWCEDPDNESMIQCQTCGLWYHVKCLRKIPDPKRRFHCDDCRKKAGKAEAVEKAAEFGKTTQQSSKNMAPSTSEKIAMNAENPATSAENIAVSAKKIASLGNQQSETFNIVDLTTSNNKIPHTIGSHSEGPKSSRRSLSSSMSSARIAQGIKLLEEKEMMQRRQLEEREKLLHEKHQLENDFLAQKQSLIESLKGSKRGSSTTGTSDRLDRTKSWIEEQDEVTRTSNRRVGFISNSHNRLDRELTRIASTSANHNLRQSTPAQWFAPKNHSQFNESYAQGIAAPNRPKLGLEQISSRHVLPRELPTFSGSPEEWPLFISSYISSTKRCGFSNEENLVRLQKALKGAALQSVRGKLMLPETVPDVLNMLRMLYGRPELILKTLIQQIRSEPPIKPESLEQFIKYALMVQNMCATIEASQLTEHMNNPMLVQELVDKLPANLKLDWAMFKRSQATTNLLSFNTWLFDIAEAASDVTSCGFEPSTSTVNKQARTRKPEQVFTTDVAKTMARQQDTPKDKTLQVACVACDGKHQLSECKQFSALNVRGRWEIIVAKKLCGNCFGSHYYRNCNARKECAVDGCRKTHHPMLHKTTESIEKKNTSRNKSERVTEENVNTHDTIIDSQTLFRVIPVTLYGKQKSISAFAFLDEGSSVTLLDAHLAQELELEDPKESLCLKWTGETTRAEPYSQRLCMEISSNVKMAKRFKISNVRTVANLNLPIQSMDAEKLKREYAHLRDLPVQEYQRAEPKILIGLPHWSIGLPIEIHEGLFGEPIGMKSRIGWSISGTLGSAPIEQVHVHLCDCRPDEQLHKLVKEYFSLENFGVRKSNVKIESNDDHLARKIIEENTKRIGNRYETGLLWRYKDITFPDSLRMAERRLSCLERKMERDDKLRDNLHQQIVQYVEKGYARPLNTVEAAVSTPRTWYLPVFAVTNPNKPGKIRLVWDAAAEVNGVSLNSMLLTGPDLLTPLPEVLYRFREKNIAVSGDIKEMFHQIQIVDRDRQSQRFLWRNIGESKISTYEMNVMTFGSTCSPSAAQFVKNRNADEFSEDYPRAAFEIKTNHYVDDWLSSFSSPHEAIEVAKEVIFVHKQAGFEIRNWLSNSPEVLETLGEVVHGEHNLNISQQQEGAKVLGMWWETSCDSLYYKLNLERMNTNIMTGNQRPTKREVLRVLMMVYDPLGLIACILVYVKILLQDIWKSGIDWDDTINDEQFKKWLKWCNTLSSLTSVQIPRCYCPTLSSSKPGYVDLHVFVDASENAYAALAYFRIRRGNEAKSVLVSAKTKVAPQKPISIPRLELQAAVLGTRLADNIIKAHSIKINSKTFWSDSANVLSWIRSTKRKYVTFVAFRIGEILENTEVAEWRYVPTKLNVADEGTKWAELPNINPSSRWFIGPQFLSKSQEEWPADKFHYNQDEDPEVKRVYTHQNSQTPNASPNPCNVTRWRVLVRAQALVLRVLNNSKRDSERRSGVIKVYEMSLAEDELIRTAQFEVYCEEIADLKSIGVVQKTSKIYQLSPFLDNKLIMRMKGRLSNATTLDYNTKNPIILPPNHSSTKLILFSYHRRYHHHNHETTVNEVRQKYWVQN